MYSFLTTIFVSLLVALTLLALLYLPSIRPSIRMDLLIIFKTLFLVALVNCLLVWVGLPPFLSPIIAYYQDGTPVHLEIFDSRTITKLIQRKALQPAAPTEFPILAYAADQSGKRMAMLIEPGGAFTMTKSSSGRKQLHCAILSQRMTTMPLRNLKQPLWNLIRSRASKPSQNFPTRRLSRSTQTTRKKRSPTITVGRMALIKRYSPNSGEGSSSRITLVKAHRITRSAT